MNCVQLPTNMGRISAARVPPNPGRVSMLALPKLDISQLGVSGTRLMAQGRLIEAALTASFGGLPPPV
jgi:hypothetical protein